VEQETIDLKKEQQATLARPRYPYTAIAKGFFRSMDVLAGGETTLAKAKLVEILATIPYRAWESRQYGRLTLHYKDPGLVREAGEIMTWSREAQDNEYWHLLVIEQKMREDAAGDPQFLRRPLPSLMVATYALMSFVSSRADIRRAFHFNAQFEDHAEHTYAQLVADHPEWEEQPVTSEVVQEHGPFDSWADVFRRIGLDERDHMNHSFAFAGMPQHLVHYQGMPAL
jgi:hypothetical protein